MRSIYCILIVLVWFVESNASNQQIFMTDLKVVEISQSTLSNSLILSNLDQKNRFAIHCEDGKTILSIQSALQTGRAHHELFFGPTDFYCYAIQNFAAGLSKGIVANIKILVSFDYPSLKLEKMVIDEIEISATTLSKRIYGRGLGDSINGVFHSTVVIE